MERKFYKFCWHWLRPIFNLIYPHRASGVENLPAEGGFVLCVNHTSAVDPVLIAACMPTDRPMMFLGKKELMEHRFVRALVTRLGMIPIDRGNADIGAVRRCMQVLREGAGLVIFPQGTRSRDNTPTPMMPGASMLALRGGVPVYPCYIDGPYGVFRRVDVRFGGQLDFSDLGRRCDAQTLQEATARIEAAVWALKDQ